MNEDELSESGRAILNTMRIGVGRAWMQGVVGAVVGGAAGWLGFTLLLSQDLYGLALPAATLGLGFALFARRPLHFAGGLFCAVSGLLLMVFCEWKIGAFNADDSFGYFLTHLHEVDNPRTIMFLVLGTVFAFWFGRGR
jgi:hypothetical protein